jgi:hypothetical protein
MQAVLQEPGIKTLLTGVAEDVKASAESTASAAEFGSPRLAGYASAGFRIEYEERSRRPRALVGSNADEQLYLRVYFATIKNWGIAHLRQALYRNTTLGG